MLAHSFRAFRPGSIGPLPFRPVAEPKYYGYGEWARKAAHNMVAGKHPEIKYLSEPYSQRDISLK